MSQSQAEADGASILRKYREQKSLTMSGDASFLNKSSDSENINANENEDLDESLTEAFFEAVAEGSRIGQMFSATKRVKKFGILDESMISNSFQGDDTELVDTVRLVISKLTSPEPISSEDVTEAISLLQTVEDKLEAQTILMAKFDSPVRMNNFVPSVSRSQRESEQEQYDNLTAYHDNLLQGLQVTDTPLTNKTDNVNNKSHLSDFQDYKYAYEDLQIKFESLVTERDDLVATCSALGEKLSQTSQAKESLREESNAVRIALMDDLTRAESDISRLKEEILSYKAITNEQSESKDDSSQRVQALEEAISELQRQMESQSSRHLEEIEAFNDLSNSYKEHIAALEAELPNLRDELQITKEELELSKEELTHLTNELSDAKVEISKSKDDLLALNEQLSISKKNSETVDQALKSALECLATTQAEVADLKSQSNTMKNNEEELQIAKQDALNALEELDILRRENDLLRTDLQDSQNELDEISYELESTKKQLSQVTQETTSTNNESVKIIDNLRLQIKELESQLSESKQNKSGGLSETFLLASPDDEDSADQTLDEIIAPRLPTSYTSVSYPPPPQPDLSSEIENLNNQLKQKDQHIRVQISQLQALQDSNSELRSGNDTLREQKKGLQVKIGLLESQVVELADLVKEKQYLATDKETQMFALENKYAAVLEENNSLLTTMTTNEIINSKQSTRRSIGSTPSHSPANSITLPQVTASSSKLATRLQKAENRVDELLSQISSLQQSNDSLALELSTTRLHLQSKSQRVIELTSELAALRGTVEDKVDDLSRHHRQERSDETVAQIKMLEKEYKVGNLADEVYSLKKLCTKLSHDLRSEQKLCHQLKEFISKFEEKDSTNESIIAYLRSDRDSLKNQVSTFLDTLSHYTAISHTVSNSQSESSSSDPLLGPLLGPLESLHSELSSLRNENFRLSHECKQFQDLHRREEEIKMLPIYQHVVEEKSTLQRQYEDLANEMNHTKQEFLDLRRYKDNSIQAMLFWEGRSVQQQASLEKNIEHALNLLNSRIERISKHVESIGRVLCTSSAISVIESTFETIINSLQVGETEESGYYLSKQQRLILEDIVDGAIKNLSRVDLMDLIQYLSIELSTSYFDCQKYQDENNSILQKLNTLEESFKLQLDSLDSSMKNLPVSAPSVPAIQSIAEPTSPMKVDAILEFQKRIHELASTSERERSALSAKIAELSDEVIRQTQLATHYREDSDRLALEVSKAQQESVKVGSLEYRLTLSQAEVQKLLNDIANLEEELSLKEQTYLSSIGSVQQQNELKIEEYEDELQGWRDRVQELTERIQNTESELQTSRNNTTLLQTQLQHQQESAASQIAQLTTQTSYQTSNLQARISSLEGQVTQLSNQLRSRELEISELQVSLRLSNDNIEECKKNYSLLEHESDKKLTDIHREYLALEETCQSLRNTLDNKESEHLLSYEQLQATYLTSCAKIGDLETQIARQNTVIHEVNLQVGRLEHQLRQSVEEKHRSILDATDKQAEKYSQSLRELQSSLDSARVENNSLSGHISDLQSANQSLHDEARRYQSEIATYQKQIQAYQDQFRASQGEHQNRIANYHDEKATLETLLTKKVDEVARYQTRFREVESAMLRLSSELAAVQQADQQSVNMLTSLLSKLSSALLVKPGSSQLINAPSNQSSLILSDTSNLDNEVPLSRSRQLLALAISQTESLISTYLDAALPLIDQSSRREVDTAMRLDILRQQYESLQRESESLEVSNIQLQGSLSQSESDKAELYSMLRESVGWGVSMDHRVRGSLKEASEIYSSALKRATHSIGQHSSVANALRDKLPSLSFTPSITHSSTPQINLPTTLPNVLPTSLLTTTLPTIQSSLTTFLLSYAKDTETTLGALCQCIVTLVTELTTQHQSIEQLQHSIRAKDTLYHQQLHLSHEKMKSIEEANGKLGETVSTREEQYSELKRLLSEATKQRNELQIELRTTQETSSILQQSLKESEHLLKQASQHNSSLQEKVDSLTLSLELANEGSETLRKRYADAQSRADSAYEECRRIKQAKDTAEGLCKSLEEEITAYRARTTSTITTNHPTRPPINQLPASSSNVDVDRLLVALSATCDIQSSFAPVRKSHRSTLDIDGSSLTAVLSTDQSSLINSHLGTASSGGSRVDAALRRLAEFRTAVREEGRQRRRGDERCEALENEIASLKMTIERLQAEASNAESKHHGTVPEGQVSYLAAELKVKDLQAGSLQEDKQKLLKELDDSKIEAEEERKARLKLSGELRLSESSNQRLRVQEAALMKQIESLKSEKETLTHQIKQLEAQTDQKAELSRTLKAALSKTQASLDQSEKARSQLQFSFDLVSSQLSDLQMLSDRQQSRIEDTEAARLVAKDEAASALEVRVAQGQRELEATLTRYALLEARFDSLVAEKTRSQDECVRLRQQLAELDAKYISEHSSRVKAEASLAVSVANPGPSEEQLYKLRRLEGDIKAAESRESELRKDLQVAEAKQRDHDSELRRTQAKLTAVLSELKETRDKYDSLREQGLNAKRQVLEVVGRVREVVHVIRNDARIVGTILASPEKSNSIAADLHGRFLDALGIAELVTAVEAFKEVLQYIRQRIAMPSNSNTFPTATSTSALIHRSNEIDKATYHEEQALHQLQEEERQKIISLARAHTSTLPTSDQQQAAVIRKLEGLLHAEKAAKSLALEEGYNLKRELTDTKHRLESMAIGMVEADHEIHEGHRRSTRRSSSRPSSGAAQTAVSSALAESASSHRTGESPPFVVRHKQSSALSGPPLRSTSPAATSQRSSSRQGATTTPSISATRGSSTSQPSYIRSVPTSQAKGLVVEPKSSSYPLSTVGTSGKKK